MIVVFGSINVDLIFRVPTLPAPGQTVLGPSYAIAMGGKGANQAVAAVRDGNAVAFVGAVGTDAFGSMALTALQAEGIDTGSIAAHAGATWNLLFSPSRGQVFQHLISRRFDLLAQKFGPERRPHHGASSPIFGP